MTDQVTEERRKGERRQDVVYAFQFSDYPGNINNRSGTDRRAPHPAQKALKPCPFCGDQAWMHSDRVFAGDFGYRIECEGECHAMTCYWHTSEQAIAAWNRRPA